MLLLLQNVLYCLLYALLIKCAVKNDGRICLYFYPKDFLEEAQIRGIAYKKIVMKRAKWFMIPLDGGSTTMPMQLEYGTIQPSSTELPQRTLQYTINNIVSLSSTRIPTIQILIRTIDDVWEIAYPTVQFTRSSTIKAKIIFYGDLTKLHTDSNNVAITFI